MTIERYLEEHAKIAELHYYDYKIIINGNVWTRNHSFIKCLDMLRASNPNLLKDDIEDSDISVDTEGRFITYHIKSGDNIKVLNSITEEELLIIFERAILSGEKDKLLQKIFEFNRQPGKQVWYFEKNKIPYIQIGETTYSLYLRETVKK